MILKLIGMAHWGQRMHTEALDVLRVAVAICHNPDDGVENAQ